MLYIYCIRVCRYIYIYICVCVCACSYRYSIFICLPDRASFSQSLIHQTTGFWHPAGHQINSIFTFFSQVMTAKSWRSALETQLCLSFSQLWFELVLFLAAMSEQAATQLAPELGHEKLKVLIYTIPMMLHCSGMVGPSWIQKASETGCGIVGKLETIGNTSSKYHRGGTLCYLIDLVGGFIYTVLR